MRLEEAPLRGPDDRFWCPAFRLHEGRKTEGGRVDGLFLQLVLPVGLFNLLK